MYTYARARFFEVVTDACVPVSQLASLMESTARDIKESGVVGPIFGHAGDGNFHAILPVTVTPPLSCASLLSSEEGGTGLFSLFIPPT